jgi:hypothetical protein
MSAAIGAALLGVLVAALAIGIPFWATHRHMRPPRDDGELRAYAEATGRSPEHIKAGRRGRPFRHKSDAGQRWREAQEGLVPQVTAGQPGQSG